MSEEVKSAKRDSDAARKLEQQEIAATQESKKAALETRQRVDEQLRGFLDTREPEEAEDNTGMRRLDVLLARAEAESATLTPMGSISEDEGAPDTLRPADVAAEASTSRAEHVLVVDDDPELVAELVNSLKQEGYSVRSAADGIEALEKALKTTVPPDIMLLDLALPYLSGMGVLAALQTTHLACLPVLIITGTSRESVPLALRREYVYVSKPIDRAEMLVQLRARIGEWRALSRALG